MKTVKIIRVIRGAGKRTIDYVTRETALCVHVPGRGRITLVCSPSALKELAAGCLFSQGIIRPGRGIRTIKIKKKNGVSHAYVSLKAGSLPRDKNSQKPPAVSARRLSAFMREFQNASAEFRRTGGVHSAALCDARKILFRHDDLGRHNAIDKVLGQAVLRQIEPENKILLTSGRVPGDIAEKIRRCGIAVFVSISAPTDRAVRICRGAGISLVGFARGRTMNIYSGEERISGK